MDLFEYQGKALFAASGVPVPKGGLATTPADARTIALSLGGAVVVKAQVQVGGRGKAGGIKVANTPEDAEAHASDILGMDIKGHTVHSVWVEEASDIQAEYYVSFTLDRGAKQHLALVSAKGGMDIEEVSATDPDAIAKLHIDPVVGLTDWQARELVYRAELEQSAARPLARALAQLYRAYVDLDCDLVEVNPLILTGDGSVVALDSKVTVDTNAFFRHPDFPDLAKAHHIDRIEKLAKERGLNFIKLEGSVGIMANGAGLAMSTLDVVNLVGGSAANFLDVGGGANADTITNALDVLTRDPSVRVALINIFGGIVRCDLVAEGILTALNRLTLPWPIVVRLDGTNAVVAREMLAGAETGKLVPVGTMREGAERAVLLAGSS